jgi:hypothetical protein
MWKLTLGYGSFEPASRRLVKSLTTGTKIKRFWGLSPKDSWCIDVLENLPCVNKTKHPKKGERKEQNEQTQVKTKRRNQESRQQEEQEQIKYSTPPPLRQ